MTQPLEDNHQLREGIHQLVSLIASALTSESDYEWDRGPLNWEQVIIEQSSIIYGLFGDDAMIYFRAKMIERLARASEPFVGSRVHRLMYELAKMILDSPIETRKMARLVGGLEAEIYLIEQVKKEQS